MHPFVKGRLVVQIENPINKVTRKARKGDEEMKVIAPDGSVLIDIFNDWDRGGGQHLKIGSKEFDVDEEDFEEIATAVRVRFLSDVAEAARWRGVESELSKVDWEMLSALGKGLQK